MPGVSDPIRIDVAAPSRPSTIWVGAGVLGRLQACLDEAGLGPRRFAVSSPTVWNHWGAAVREAAPAVEPVSVPDGERNKTLAVLADIYDALYRGGADRSSAVVSVGGGVLTDMAGLAAATYLRGIGLAHVPTTLLAQVDAAVGGKVGVNLPGGKNLVGAFYQPWVVVSDPQVLSTLPRREFRAGMYEVIKYGFACRSSLFEAVRRDLPTLTRRDPESLAPIIAECCRIKAGIVARDEREAGPREVLNFGHTAGHAFEALTRYKRFLHGEAVAHGMMVAADLAEARGLMPPGRRADLGTLIAKLGPLPTVADLPRRAVIEQMRHDKKARDGKIRFVLPVEIGETVTVDDATDEELEAALQRCGVGN